MKPRKSMKLTAILLAAVVLSTDVWGGSSLVQAAQQTEQAAVQEENQEQAGEREFLPEGNQPASEEAERESSESENTEDNREFDELSEFPEELMRTAEDNGENGISPEEAFAELL